MERVHQAAQEFRSATNRTMGETTKRTLSENVAIEGQLARLREKTTEVHHDNQHLRRSVTMQKHQVRNYSVPTPPGKSWNFYLQISWNW